MKYSVLLIESLLLEENMWNLNFNNNIYPIKLITANINNNV